MKQPLSIAIRFSPHYKIHISVSDPFVFQQLKDYLETQEFVTFQTRGKRKLLRKELKITKLWEKISEDTLSIDAGFVDYLYGGWLRLLDKEYYDISLDIQMPTIHPVSIIEKWEPLLRDNQKEDIRALTRFYGGLSSQHTGYGKAQPLTSFVLTPTGFLQMRDIKLEDKVSTPNGETANVVGIFPQGEIDVYEITFSDGVTARCSEDHLWLTSTHYERSKKKMSLKTLKEIKETLYRYDGRSNHSIPLTQSVYFEKQELSLDPYLLGLLLGDGGLTHGTPVFTSADQELIDEVRKRLPEGTQIRKIPTSKYDYTITKIKGKVNPLTLILKDLGIWGKLSINKSIPSIYLHSSHDDRLSLLRGLMDTDGWFNKCGRSYSTTPEFGTSSKQLAFDVIYLVQSLGGIAKLRFIQKTNSYRISISLGINPFTLTRKLSLWKPYTKYFPTRYIRSIKYIGKEECQCIKLDDKDNLYITDNFIVTHNTRIMLAIVESLLPERCLILVPSSGILEEVQERGETFGVEIPQYKWTHEVSILNPMGFLRSKEAENSQAIQWLSKVRHVFTDEAHHLQAMSWDQMFSKFLPNVVRSYGFSASPDVKEGQDLSPQTMPIKALGHKNSKILGLSGSIRVTRKSHAEVSVVKVVTEITPEIMVESLKKATWQESLDLMLSRPFCAQVIETILARFPDIKFYIPIHKVDTGIQLYKNLQQRGVSGVFWSEKYVFPAKEDKKEADLAFVKHHVLQDTCRFLMTTSVGFEGIDIPALAGIIPLIGTSFRMTIQPAGRSIRGGSLVYVLIYDKHNRLVKKQMDKRLSKMKQEYSELKATRVLRIT